jgi:hypothetical protein
MREDGAPPACLLQQHAHVALAESVEAIKVVRNGKKCKKTRLPGFEPGSFEHKPEALTIRLSCQFGTRLNRGSETYKNTEK